MATNLKPAPINQIVEPGYKKPNYRVTPKRNENNLTKT